MASGAAESRTSLRDGNGGAGDLRVMRHGVAPEREILRSVRHAHEAVGEAEYKQVTVLFADVVHSMDTAAAVAAGAAGARAHRDETGYLTYAKDYGALANSLGFEAHMAQARVMSSWPAMNVT
jgi:hypothetical protein